MKNNRRKPDRVERFLGGKTRRVKGRRVRHLYVAVTRIYHDNALAVTITYGVRKVERS